MKQGVPASCLAGHMTNLLLKVRNGTNAWTQTLKRVIQRLCRTAILENFGIALQERGIALDIAPFGRAPTITSRTGITVQLMHFTKTALVLIHACAQTLEV